jgi:uncharacterized membrane protein YcfT
MCHFNTGAKMFSSSTQHNRIDWVDYAKGICIILVVMMHATLGVEKAVGHTGALSAFIEWARPFRMPDFFLISGLFLSRRINAGWRQFFDSKVLHFAYFYILWMTIQFALKSPAYLADYGIGGILQAYALGFVEPFGTLWFIYILAVFFVVTKLLKSIAPVLIFAAAAVLEILPVHTGWLLVDEFASRYVYFFAGYWLATQVFASANLLFNRTALAVASMLFIWAMGHSAVMAQGISNWPFVSLCLGFAGASAVIATATLAARSQAVPWLRYLGANSIVIYLAFFLFMAGTRSAGLKLVPGINVDALAALSTLAGVVGPILLFWAVRNTPLKFLFKRPASISLMQVETAAKPPYSAGHDILLKQPQAR